MSSLMHIVLRDADTGKDVDEEFFFEASVIPRVGERICISIEDDETTDENIDENTRFYDVIRITHGWTDIRVSSPRPNRPYQKTNQVSIFVREVKDGSV